EHHPSHRGERIQADENDNAAGGAHKPPLLSASGTKNERTTPAHSTPAGFDFSSARRARHSCLALAGWQESLPHQSDSLSHRPKDPVSKSTPVHTCARQDRTASSA